MFRVLMSFIENKRAQIDLLMKINMFLRPGIYVFDNSLSFLYLKDGWSYKKARELFETNKSPLWRILVLFIIKLIFFRKNIIITHNTDMDVNRSNFSGTVCSLGLNRKNLKIFDFINNKVITSYLDYEEYNTTIKNYSYFRRFFPLPELLDYNNQKLFMAEELVMAKPVRQWSDDDCSYVINDVFKRYNCLFNEMKCHNNYTSRSPLWLISKLDAKDRIGMGLLKSIDHSLLTTRFPFLQLHGDLWTPNILLRERNEQGIKYIDWEFTDRFVFFYDIFWLITEQALMKDNFYYLSNYLAGMYDSSLKTLFKIFDLEFNEEYRVDYIKIFFLNFWAARWSRLSRSRRLQHFIQYKRLIKRISEIDKSGRVADIKNSISKTVVTIMLLTIVSKIVGFIRDITLSYYYGASHISDVFLVSLTIPSIIFGIIGTGLSPGYIPMYNRIVAEQGWESGNKFTSNLINLLAVVCTIIVAAGLIFTEPAVRLFASGFKGETLALAVRFTKITLFGIYFTGALYIFNSYLQMNENYIVPALVGLPLNIIIITAIVLSWYKNLMLLPLSRIFGVISEIILVLIFVYKAGYRHSFNIDIKNRHVREMVSLSIPIILGTSINQINMLVDRTIASRIAVGGITALEYSNRLVSFVEGIFASSVIAVFFPKAAKFAAENNLESVNLILSKAVNNICFLIIPASIGAMILAEPIVKMLFGRGAFDSAAAGLTSSALFFYSIGIVGMGVKDILARIFFSLHDTRTPMINAAFALTVNIVLNIILSKYMGIGGLALASSISSIFCAGLLLLSLRKKIGPLGIRSLCISIFKILIASIVMGAFAMFSLERLKYTLNANLSLFISILLGALVYFLLANLIKAEWNK